MPSKYAGRYYEAFIIIHTISAAAILALVWVHRLGSGEVTLDYIDKITSWWASSHQSL